MASKSRTSIPYRFWPEFKSINLVSEVYASRDEVPLICERLHAFVAARRGACFYYPSIPNRTTVCRYEWPRGRGKDPFALRLGFVVIVRDEDLKEVHSYITTNDAVQNPEADLPMIPTRLFNVLKQELIDALAKVFEDSSEILLHKQYSVFFIEMQSSISEAATLGDEDVVVFPTRIIRKTRKWVSAVAVKTTAASSEGAKLSALHTTSLFCALITLANARAYKTVQVPVRKNVAKAETFESLAEITPDKLYSMSNVLPGSWNEHVNFGAKAEVVWNSYQKLSEADRDKLLPALFAYYSGQEIRNKHPTLAIVSFIAALSALASDEKQKCPGELTCTVCGTLRFRHDTKGDQAAVTSLICRLLQIADSDRRKEIRNLIRRVYGEQRSAFVHSAILRYEEYHKQSNLPAAFPTPSEPVRSLYFYKRDLNAINDITRHVLLEWMAEKSGTSIDNDLLGLTEIKIENARSVEAVLTLPARRWVQVITNAEKQVDDF